MSSIKDLKKRIGIVKNIQQTTRAMKMVSASKLRKAQDSILHHRPYARKVFEFIQDLLPEVPLRENHPLLKRTLSAGVLPKRLFVLVTSDRGLCGGFNQNVIRTCQQWLKEKKHTMRDVELCFVGKKGYDYFKTKNEHCGPYYREISGRVTFLKAKTLADVLLKRYLSHEVDEIQFIYNEFQNAITQHVIIENFLPLELDILPQKELASRKNVPIYLIQPSVNVVLEELLKKTFSIQVFKILLESQAGEHGARMSAMENSTQNAEDMIYELTLQFNKQRQAGITKELLEIIAGNESQKSD